MESVDEAQEAIVEKDGVFEFFFVKNPSAERTKPDAYTKLIAGKINEETISLV
jgi:hypothetical protein